MLRRTASSAASIALLILAPLASPWSAHAQTHAERAERVEEVVRSAHDAGMFNGAVLVVEDGETLYRGAFGLADREEGRPNSPDAPFEIYSLTKPMTAIATLQLVDEGRIALDGVIHDYLPDFPSAAAESITIHQLLTHTHGLPEFMMAMPGWLEYDPPDVSADSALAFVAALPLEYEPGAGYAYTNTGYVLLARIIERVTGRPYGEVLEARIFDPLGMENTRWTDDPRAVPGMATTYLPGGEEPAPPGPVFPGPGGVVSTLDDMALFAGALGSDALLSPEMWRQAFTPHTSPEDAVRFHPATTLPYGYGFSLAELPVTSGRTGRVAQHGGLGYGGSSMLMRWLDGGRIVLLWNNIQMPPMIPGLIEVLAGEPPPNDVERR